MAFLLDILDKASFLAKMAIGTSFMLHLFLPRNPTYFIMDMPCVDLLPMDFSEEYGNGLKRKERPKFEIGRTDVIIAGTIAAIWISKRRYFPKNLFE